MNQSLIKIALGALHFAQSNRYELLESLTDSDFKYKPQTINKKIKIVDFCYQFATIGGTYQAYTELLKRGSYDGSIFSDFEYSLTENNTVSSMKKALVQIDQKFETEILLHSDNETFKWGDITAPIWRTVYVAIEMERLCHGEMICYFALKGIDFPDKVANEWGIYSKRA